LSISHEFGLNLWARGSGYEYRRLDVIRDAGVPVILPLNFPDTPDVESPESAMNVSLEDLRHWDLAPENPGRLSNAGIKIALTGSGLGSNTSFLDNLRVAVERGLDQDAALEALTLTPAIMLGVERHYGSLERGKTASFIVADGNIFERSVKVEEVWIDGKPYEITETGKTDLRGKWKAEIDGIGEVEIDISGTDRRLRGKLNLDDKSVDLLRVSTDNHRVTIGFRGDSIGVEGIVRLSASVTEKELYGIGEMPDGKFINWKAARLSDHEEARNDDTRRPAGMSELTMLYPSMEYGFEKRPDMHDNVVVRNATIWTQGPAGKLENADLYVRRGRIVEVGRGLDVPRGAVVIDGTGKHVTPGLVDPHLHSSIRGGVNEVGNNMTPETRITDVIEPDNIWVYRLLAGGMTTANLLHGSANPVGGQDAVVKMRWGALPDEMLLEGAKPGLKLALGENVVRNSNQYPNTRMGAEQIIRDAFQATKDYMARWENWEREKSGIPPRKDLQLEAMAEVLRGERIIHAHAYRQDEMQMLMRLAEDMGFRIATFEHTVEGYKIADILREHGAGAIIWTDWSSFKVEAADGILYNARILLDQGVHTALHSDNTQLSTRMNWEAGKMLATGIDEIAAMDLITINPAKMIGIDEMVGSLEPGKHADFVIWNGHPLSGFTHAEQTWVDGRKYFDREQDMLLREEVRVERAALIQKAAAASDNQGSGDQAARRTSGHN
ncbi:MAG: amidohydrolase, partial [Bacteroidia bacterium]